MNNNDEYVEVDINGKPKKNKKIKSAQSGELRAIIITLILGLALFFVQLPALNLKSPDFYSFIFLLLAFYSVARLPSSIKKASVELAGVSFRDFSKENRRRMKPILKIFYPVVAMAAIVLLFVVGTFVSSPIIRANSYKELLDVQTGNFTEDVSQVTYNQVPLLDKNSAQMLGDRKLGELSDLVSQFEVTSNYNQINYDQRPVRVTPLEYGDFFKWLGNRTEGLPAYIIVDMLSQEVTVERLEEGMKYSMSEPLFRNVYRTLRFNYPFYMFDTPVFEIDDEGTPYWVAPRVTNTIGLFGGRDVVGVVLMNAQTGEMEYMEVADVPTWVDAVYSADLIIQQYDYYGRYQNGFINSIFGQRGMTMTTRGYNYMALNGDVYVYTGITSVGGDQSNVGFILTNQRTKETNFYSIAGADEYSAMNSAEGVVQHLGYNATFPLLLNVYNEPTYFIALKDNAQLVKMYAMVNVSSYQIVATGATIAETERAYIQLMQNNSTGGSIGGGLGEGLSEGVIEEIRTAVIDGNSVFYFKIMGEDTLFSMAATSDNRVIALNVGDKIAVTYTFIETPITPATSIELVE